MNIYGVRKELVCRVFFFFFFGGGGGGGLFFPGAGLLKQ